MKRMTIIASVLACLASPALPATAKPKQAATATKSAPAAPVASPQIMMLRFYVGNIDRAESFYNAVFDMRTVQKMGDNVRIMIFPSGKTPGIILIQSPEEATMNGSFIIQVPDLKATLDKVAANGGTLQNTKFEQNMGGMAARSSHFNDPDGNVIEVLQIGGNMPK